MTLTGRRHSRRNAFAIDDEQAEKLMNARRPDEVEAADWPVTVIHGKHPW